jgi:predicted ABC-type ATPase
MPSLWRYPKRLIRPSKLSIGRVSTRKLLGGHDVEVKKLIQRLPRTQKAIRAALNVADTAILFDNSRTQKLAFTLAQIRKKDEILSG